MRSFCILALLITLKFEMGYGNSVCNLQATFIGWCKMTIRGFTFVASKNACRRISGPCAAQDNFFMDKASCETACKKIILP
eukprot:NP_001162865.1 seminal fluid protein 24C1 [Drosophila melanogaster]